MKYMVAWAWWETLYWKKITRLWKYLLKKKSFPLIQSASPFSNLYARNLIAIAINIQWKYHKAQVKHHHGKTTFSNSNVHLPVLLYEIISLLWKAEVVVWKCVSLLTMFMNNVLMVSKNMHHVQCPGLKHFLQKRNFCFYDSCYYTFYVIISVSHLNVITFTTDCLRITPLDV